MSAALYTSTQDTNVQALERREIDQIRRLLFGEQQNAIDGRINELEAKLENLQRQLTNACERFDEKFTTEQQCRTMAQANLVAEIGASINTLGDSISQLAKAPRDGGLSHAD